MSEDDPFKLLPLEHVWTQNYAYILEKGYKLRRRYEPGWVGSWVEEGLTPEKVLSSGSKRYERYDDSVAIDYPVVDAVRVKDKSLVVLKHIEPSNSSCSVHVSQEVEILNLLSSPDLRDHPHNPCPLLLQSFPLENPSDGTILVFEMTRDAYIPPFRLVVEGLSFIRQMFEQLVFLHERNITHRDIYWCNTMMDKSLYPNGMNPLTNFVVYDKVLPSEPKHLDRIDVDVRYYMIDFGNSIMFPSEEERTLVVNDGAAIKLREFHTTDEETGELVLVPHDPFKADVLQLGILLHFAFGKSMKFLKPLLLSTVEDPDQRPTARECLAMFEELTQNLSRVQLLGRIQNDMRRGDYEGLPFLERVTDKITRNLKGRADYFRLVVKAIMLNRGRSF